MFTKKFWRPAKTVAQIPTTPLHCQITIRRPNVGITNYASLQADTTEGLAAQAQSFMQKLVDS